MHYAIVAKVLGRLLLLVAGLMAPSLVVAIIYQGPDIPAFLFSIGILVAIGVLSSFIPTKDTRIKIIDGLAVVTLGWVLAALFGSLPFIFSGSITSPVDAFFETISGMTTTGATILTDIEVLPRGILFWRSFTHWIGGMGILVFIIAIIPTLGVGGFHIFKAESPGPVADKIVPRIKDTAKILYIAYFLLTIAETILLLLGGMTLYDALVHSFGTLGTGGFSVKNASIAAYGSTYIHVVISIFMLLAGTNFSLYFAIYKGNWKSIFEDREFRFYMGVVLVSTLLIAGDLILFSDNPVGRSLRDSLFQVASITTTTGYGTADFDQWSNFSKMILFTLMFIGGSAGSTSGGMKSIRILVLLKVIKRELQRVTHPRGVFALKLGDKPVANETVSSITSFFVLYMALFAGGTLLITLIEGYDLVSSASSVAATLGNIGPGFELVGPTRNFSHFSDTSKLLFSALMLLGRLELYTVLALVAPKNWRS